MKMNGIKFGTTFTRAVQDSKRAENKRTVYEQLSSNCINIDLLNMDFTRTRPYVSCCIEKEHRPAVVEIVETVTHDVNTLSVYPHRSSLNALGYLVRLMSEKSLLFYDFVTSGSLLTFVVDHQDQGEICGYIARHLDLPDSCTPFRQELDPKDKALLKEIWPETAATYVEKKIKTYGINTRTGLDLYTIQAGHENLAPAAAIIQELEEEDARFYFSSAHTRPDGLVIWHIAADKNARTLKDRLLSTPETRRLIDLKITDEIALISFQGPHFGDRYGIADQAMSALESASVAPLLAGFTGSCIYMALPENRINQACSALENVFETP